MRKYILCVFISMTFTRLMGAPALPSLSFSEAPKELHVHNRIVARANGTAISVMDVTRKLNEYFEREHKEYSDNDEARHQFYMNAWGYTLNDLINKQLVLADAKERQLPVSQGDIREEMEEQFGPNMVETLDSLGMSYEEAHEMVEADITIRRMMWYRVNAKALFDVVPAKLKAAYEEFIEQQQGKSECCYQVIAFRGEDTAKCAEAARKAYELLVAGDSELEGIELDDSVKLTISPKYRNSEASISEAHREGIASLEDGQYSEPVEQVSRAANETVHRIYYLNERLKRNISFDEVEETLKDELLQVAFGRESEAYINYLRERFEVEIEMEDEGPSRFFSCN